MLQVVPKWKITVQFVDRAVVVFISEHHVENVLRQVAAIQWSESALDTPREIHIELQR